MKSHTMTSQVVYWRWTSPTNTALVTPTSVFHWSVDVHSYEPAKVFDRKATLADGQIINYQVSDDGKWCLLTSIATGAA